MALCRSATCLLKRLEHTHSALMAVRHMLPSVPDAAKTLKNYEQTHIALEGFIFSKHDEWFKTIDSSIKDHLQNSLLTQDKADRESAAGGSQLLAALGWTAQHPSTAQQQRCVCVLSLCAPVLLAGNLLSMNYDRQLLSMSQEVQHWERLRMTVPYIAMEIQAQREKHRVLRDNVLILVHDYNKVGGPSSG